MTAALPWERANGKVGDRLWQRLAAVCVRQPTRQQLLNHQEPTRLQYALKHRAVALGWEADRVLVIDDDLGMSATTALARTGFQRLVTEIGLDHVGLVLGLEMSRLVGDDLLGAQRETSRLLRGQGDGLVIGVGVQGLGPA